MLWLGLFKISAVLPGAVLQVLLVVSTMMMYRANDAPNDSLIRWRHVLLLIQTCQQSYRALSCKSC